MGRCLKLCSILITLILGMADMGSAMTPAVIAHDLFVRLEPSQHRLMVVDRVSVRDVRADRLAFSLAGHLAVGRVDVDDKPAEFTFDGGRLHILLPSRGKAQSIRIEYGGVFDDEIPVDPVNTDNPGFGVTGTIDARGTMLLAGALWYPHSREFGSVYEITVDAPEGVAAITSGAPLGHTTENGRSRSRWRVDTPLRGIPLVAGTYTVASQRFGDVVAATYFTAPLEHLSKDYLSAIGRYLKLYQELFGPYPFEQFAVVENAFPTGYGFPSFTLMGRRVLRLPFIIHTSLGHEIAHCWWGNGVLVDPSQGNWSEGLTTYVADYLYKERRGEGISHRRQWLRNYASLVSGDKDFAPSGFIGRTDPATKVVGYDKVAMVFHMLRQKLGEEAFWQSLREIYMRHRFEAIAWLDFRKVFEARSGIDLGPYFAQWIFRPGAPELALSKVRVTDNGQGFKVSGTIRQESPYFAVTLELSLETGQDTATQRIEISGAQTPFVFNVSAQPKRLTADPDVHLFRRLAPQEIPPTVNAIKGASSVSVVVADNLDPAAMALARRLAAAMGLSRARIATEASFTSRQLKGSDLLFVGTPTRTQGWPLGGDSFAITPEGFILNGETFDGEGMSFFGVFRHPDNPERAAAVFIPGRLDAAASVSTKIPHYGKYSYLVFNEAGNQVKGTWNAVNSPLSVTWPADKH